MKTALVNIINKSNGKFIKNATTHISEFPPFLPSMNAKKSFVDFVSNDGLLQKQSTAEDGYKNMFETLKSIVQDYGNKYGAYRIKLDIEITVVAKEEAELEYNDDYVPKEHKDIEEANEDKHSCPECKLIIDAINAGKKMIGNINLTNTAIESPYAIMETKNAVKKCLSIIMDNKSFIINYTDDDLFDNRYKISMIKVFDIKLSTNTITDSIEKIRDMFYPQTSDKYKHYLLEYTANGVLDDISISAYVLSPSELRTYLDGELKIAPIHVSKTDILWIPIRYTKRPFLNTIRHKGNTTDIAENYVDTVVGNIRIKTEDRINNQEYIEHHNEIKWLDKVGFSKSADEIILYVK